MCRCIADAAICTYFVHSCSACACILHLQTTPLGCSPQSHSQPVTSHYQITSTFLLPCHGLLASWIPQKGKRPRSPPWSLDTRPFLTQSPRAQRCHLAFRGTQTSRHRMHGCHLDDVTTTRKTKKQERKKKTSFPS